MTSWREKTALQRGRGRRQVKVGHSAQQESREGAADNNQPTRRRTAKPSLILPRTL